MRVGVTGGGGFIGGHVVDHLHARGHDTVVFDHMGRGVFLGDVRDATAVTELAAHVDGIVHLAAVLGTQETIANPRPAAETNILGTINVLEACRQYQLPMVNICVGNWKMRNTYSSTKHCAERLVEQYRDNLGLAAVNVRCVNAYGPRQAVAAPFGAGKVRKVTPAFICRALTGMPVEVYGDGSQVSDMVHVHDVARVLVAALEHCADGTVPQHVLEVGPQKSSTILDVALTVCDIAESRGYRTAGVSHLPMRPGEDPTQPVTADPFTLDTVGIEPSSLTVLDVGLADTVDWYARNEGVTWHRPT